MHNAASYDSVFSRKIPIETWPLLVEIYKGVDRAFAKSTRKSTPGERFSSHWRPFVAFLFVAKALGRFDYRTNDLTTGLLGVLKQDLIDEMLDFMRGIHGSPLHQKPTQQAVEKLVEAAGRTWSISGKNVVGKRDISAEAEPSTALVERVFSYLPPQPWPVRVHEQAAIDLGCSTVEVKAAIKILIEQRRCFQQIDGIVFGVDGEVLAVDSSRESRSVEELRASGLRYVSQNASS